MQFKQIISRAAEYTIKSISNPNHFWDIVIERKITNRVLIHFYLPLLTLAVLAEIIGEFLSNPEALLSYSLILGVKQLIVYILYYFIAVFAINKLLVLFGGKEDNKSAQMSVGYSMAPFFIVSALTGLFPFLYPINILGLYGLFIFYCGAPKLFEIPDTRTKPFIIAAVLANFSIFAVLNIIFWKILEVFY